MTRRGCGAELEPGQPHSGVGWGRGSSHRVEAVVHLAVVAHAADVGEQHLRRGVVPALQPLADGGEVERVLDDVVVVGRVRERHLVERGGDILNFGAA